MVAWRAWSYERNGTARPTGERPHTQYCASGGRKERTGDDLDAKPRAHKARTRDERGHGTVRAPGPGVAQRATTKDGAALFELAAALAAAAFLNPRVRTLPRQRPYGLRRGALKGVETYAVLAGRVPLPANPS